MRPDKDRAVNGIGGMSTSIGSYMIQIRLKDL